MPEFSIIFRGDLSDKITDEQLICIIKKYLNLFTRDEELPKSITLESLSVMSNEVVWEK
jgi:hypothetical protein